MSHKPGPVAPTAFAGEAPVDHREADQAWMTRGVAGIGGARFLAALGHEVPTALLPSFLTSTLGAPPPLRAGPAGTVRFAGVGYRTHQGRVGDRGRAPCSFPSSA